MLRIEELREFQIDGALQLQRHGLIAGRGNVALEMEIGVGSLNGALRHVEHAVAVVDLNWRRSSQLDFVLVGNLENGNGDMRFKLLHVFERPMERGLDLRLAADVAGLFWRIERQNRLQRKNRCVQARRRQDNPREMDGGLCLNRRIERGG